ncbi:MAG TPA: hypothetical protein VHA75_20745 [Rugosimonospora sp.]|nr:hypothetical protein [Rugosimonospora sp.]
MLKMLTTHALVCDGAGCDAYLVPRGHYDVTRRVDAVILSDAVHAIREAQAAGWRHDPAIGAAHPNLCPPCAKTHTARQEEPR